MKCQTSIRVTPKIDILIGETGAGFYSKGFKMKQFSNDLVLEAQELFVDKKEY